MKKMYVLLAFLGLSFGLYSCTDTSTADTEALYQQQANDDEGPLVENPFDPEDPL